MYCVDIPLISNRSRGQQPPPPPVAPSINRNVNLIELINNNWNISISGILSSMESASECSVASSHKYNLEKKIDGAAFLFRFDLIT